MRILVEPNGIDEIAEVLALKGEAIVVRVFSNAYSSQDVRLLLDGDENEESFDLLPDYLRCVDGLIEWLGGLGSFEYETAIRKFSDGDDKTWLCVADRISCKFCLYIFGGGHVGQAVGLIGNLVGFEVTIIDDREQFVLRERFPDSNIKLIAGKFDETIDKLEMNRRAGAVIVTRGHQFDEICLRKLLKKDLRYLGMIGSKRRVLAIFKRLTDMGFSAEELKRVHAPIGLSIGAKSPQEIAIAIIGEVISELN